MSNIMKKLSVTGTIKPPKVIFTEPVQRNEEEDFEVEDDGDDYYESEEDEEEQTQEQATYELQNQEEFPSLGLGGEYVEDSDGEPQEESESVAVAPAPVVKASSGMSWASVGKSEVTGATNSQTVPLQVRPVQTTIIEANKTAIHAAEASFLPPTATQTTPSTASGSRIIVSAAHTSSYSSVIAPEKAAEEDDGEGWANPSNIKSLKANGQVHNMVQVSASAVTSTSSTGKKTKKNKNKKKENETESASLSKNEEVTLSENHENCDHESNLEDLEDNEGFEVVAKKKTTKKKVYKKNYNKKSNNGNVSLETSMSRIGFVTTDFTMQNVMMQIGMKIISVSDGMQIHNITHYIMRCAACYTVHYDMSKLFCSKCGK